MAVYMPSRVSGVCLSSISSAIMAAKRDHEDGQELVFLLEEGHGALRDGSMDECQTAGVFFFQAHGQRNTGHFLHVNEGDGQAQQRQDRGD